MTTALRQAASRCSQPAQQAQAHAAPELSAPLLEPVSSVSTREIDETRCGPGRLDRGVIFAAIPDLQSRIQATRSACAPVDSTKPEHNAAPQEDGPGFFQRLGQRARQAADNIRQEWNDSSIGAWVGRQLEEGRERFVNSRAGRWLIARHDEIRDSRLGQFVERTCSRLKEKAIQVAQFVQKFAEDTFDKVQETSQEIARKSRDKSREDARSDPSPAGALVMLDSSDPGRATLTQQENDYYLRLQEHQRRLELDLQPPHLQPISPETMGEIVAETAENIRDAKKREQDEHIQDRRESVSLTEGENRQELAALLSEEGLDSGTLLALIPGHATDGVENGGNFSSQRLDTAALRAIARAAKKPGSPGRNEPQPA